MKNWLLWLALALLLSGCKSIPGPPDGWFDEAGFDEAGLDGGQPDTGQDAQTDAQGQPDTTAEGGREDAAQDGAPDTSVILDKGIDSIDLAQNPDTAPPPDTTIDTGSNQG